MVLQSLSYIQVWKFWSSFLQPQYKIGECIPWARFLKWLTYILKTMASWTNACIYWTKYLTDTNANMKSRCRSFPWTGTVGWRALNQSSTPTTSSPHPLAVTSLTSCLSVWSWICICSGLCLIRQNDVFLYLETVQ